MQRSILLVFLMVSLVGVAASLDLDNPGVGDDDIGLGLYNQHCVDNPDSIACQSPVFADSQSLYMYDLRSSWVFGGTGEPTDQGPSVFTGGQSQAHTSSLETRDDSVSGETKTEYFIENTGEAEGGEQEEWGLGTFNDVGIFIDSSIGEQMSLGERLVNPPLKHEGFNSLEQACGDGFPNIGDRASCPEDHGLPDVVLTDEPSPSRTIIYDSTGTESFSLPNDGAPSIDTHVDGQSSGEPDYHTGGGYIIKDTVERSDGTIGEITHSFIESTEDTMLYTESASGEIDDFSGPGATGPENVCVGVENRDDEYIENSIDWENGDPVTKSGPEMYYEAVDDYSSGTVTADVDYNSGYSADGFYRCNDDRDVSGCDEDESLMIWYDEGADGDASFTLDGEPADTLTADQGQHSSEDTDYRELSSGDMQREDLVTGKSDVGQVEHEWVSDAGTRDNYDVVLEDRPRYDRDNQYTYETTRCVNRNRSDTTYISGTLDEDSQTTYFTAQAEEYLAATGDTDSSWYTISVDKNEVTGGNGIYECVENSTDYYDCDPPPGSSLNCASLVEDRYNHFFSDEENVKEKESKIVTVERDEYDIDESLYCSLDDEVDYYEEEGETSAATISNSEYTFTYDSFEIERENIWGYVNSVPEMFSKYFSGIDVVDSGFGYHTDVQDDTLESHGSNNPAVSANQYRLIEAGSNFVAENIEYHVSNADGSKGQNNIVFAYDEQDGIVGQSRGLDYELWDSSSDQYVDLGDVESQFDGCSGDERRCIAVVNIKTDTSGWSTNPSQSFSIEIE